MEDPNKQPVFRDRSLSEVFEDGFNYVGQNINALLRIATTTVLPVLVILAIVNAITTHFFEELIPQDIFMDPEDISIEDLPIGLLTLLALISLIAYFIGLVFYINFNASSLKYYAQKGAFESLEEAKQTFKGHLTDVLGGVFFMIILAIFIGILAFILLLPVTLTGSLFLGFVATIIAVLVLPVLFYAFLSAFMSLVYNGDGYLHGFFQQVQRGFKNFGRSWVISFFTPIIAFIIILIPQIVVSALAMWIPEMIDAAALSVLVNAVLALLGEFLNFAFLTLTFIVFGFYYFTLAHEFEGGDTATGEFNEEQE